MMNTARAETVTAARPPRASRFLFPGALALLFGAGAAFTVVECVSMTSMHGMSMPGGWTMSMMWMRMPGQTWPGLAASFLGMWFAMMTAMMLPSIAPALLGFRKMRGSADAVAACGGYFAVWMLVGAAVFPLAVGFATIAMAVPAIARAVPLTAGIVVLLAGALQFTGWKAHHLRCCRSLPSNAGGAWRQGVRLGLHCVRCSAGLMAILLVTGIMDLAAMTVVTLAMTAERLATEGARTARVTGVAASILGAYLVLDAIT